MAKAIKKLANGLSLRYLVKSKKYFITFGVLHIKINDEYCNGFETLEEAEQVAVKLTPTTFNEKWYYPVK